MTCMEICKERFNLHVADKWRSDAANESAVTSSDCLACLDLDRSDAVDVGNVGQSMGGDNKNAMWLVE